MLKYFLPLLALTLCLAPNSASADLVVDNFQQVDAVTTVYSAGGQTVDRSATGSYSYAQGLGFLSAQSFAVTYTVGGSATNFGAITTDFADSFSIFAAQFGTAFELDVYTNNGIVLADGLAFTNGEQVFDGNVHDISTASSITFSFANTTMGGLGTGFNAAGFGGSFSAFSAVPEPTSLALAGMGLASICCIRRRRR